MRRSVPGSIGVAGADAVAGVLGALALLAAGCTPGGPDLAPRIDAIMQAYQGERPGDPNARQMPPR